MARKKLDDLTRDPFIIAMAGADDLQPIPEHFAAGWLSISLTVLQDWRREGRTPPQAIKVTDKKVVYPMGELRRFVREALEAAQATLAERRPPTSLPPLKHSSAADRMGQITGTKDLSSLGLDDEMLRGGRRKKVRQNSFPQFMAQAEPEDEWVFAMIPDPHQGAYRRPVDLIETLNMPLEQIGDGTCEQLTMTDYLKRLTDYLNAKAGQDQAYDRAAGTLLKGQGLPSKGTIKRS